MGKAKRKKQLIILIAVLVVLIGIAIGISSYDAEIEKIKLSNQIFFSVNEDEITNINWQYSVLKFSFSKKDGKWINDLDPDYPVRDYAMQLMTGMIKEITATYVIEDVPQKNLGTYGLADPKVVVHVTCGNETKDLYMGTYSSMDKQRYMSIGDGNVYLASDDIYENFYGEEGDFILKDDIPELEEIEYFNMSINGKKLNIERIENAGFSYSDLFVYYTDVNGKKMPLDTNATKQMYRNLGNVVLENYVSYDGKAENFTKYGLDNPELKVETKFTERYTNEVHEMVVRINKLSNGKIYANIEGSPMIYEVEAERYDILMAVTYESLRPTTIINPEWSSVTKAQFTIDGEKYDFDVKYDGTQDQWYFKDHNISTSDLKLFATGLVSTEFIDEHAAKALEMDVNLTLNKAGNTNYRVTFYKYNGTYCLAYLNGSPYCLCYRSKVVQLKEAVNAIVLNY